MQQIVILNNSPHTSSFPSFQYEEGSAKYIDQTTDGLRSSVLEKNIALVGGIRTRFILASNRDYTYTSEKEIKDWIKILRLVSGLNLR